MGLSFSRSVKFGAVRFNFSGSGIGMSLGVRGMRVGTGPRGAYISGGLGGFRYRKSLNGGRQASRATASPDRPRDARVAEDVNIVATVAHDTKSVLALADSSGDALLRSMNEQRAKVPHWPFVGSAGVALFWWTGTFGDSLPSTVRIALVAGIIGVTGWTFWRDQMRRLTVLFFEPDQATSDHFARLCASIKEAAGSRKLKSIATTSRYADTKYSAGATQGLKFDDASITLGQAPGVVANVDVPLLVAGRTTLAFFPDRVLAFQGKSVGAVDYANLRAESGRLQYVESDSVPGDARVVGHTWQYVNKNGGPDRRFKNNRQLPVCAYNQLNLSTADGLDVRFLGSKDGAFDRLVASLHSVRKAEP